MSLLERTLETISIEWKSHDGNFSIRNSTPNCLPISPASKFPLDSDLIKLHTKIYIDDKNLWGSSKIKKSGNHVLISAFLCFYLKLFKVNGGWKFSNKKEKRKDDGTLN